jgi:hypothetical protein
MDFDEGDCTPLDFVAAIRAALADREPFVLPTEAGARFECEREQGGITYVFETCVGREIFYWEVDDHERYSAAEVMDQFTDHRLIEDGE